MKKVEQTKKCKFSGSRLPGWVAVAGWAICVCAVPVLAGNAVPLNDERNRFSQVTGPETYNAPAYQKMKDEIRQSISMDSSLSQEARRTEVFVRNDSLVVRGEVENSSEENRIMHYSREAAGMAMVKNQLTVREDQ